MVDVDGTVAAELAGLAGDLIQVTREALSNVGRHADATSVRVTLRRIDTAPSSRSTTTAPASTSTAPRGWAWPTSRDRVDAIGGELAVESLPGEGTTVRARLPL